MPLQEAQSPHSTEAANCLPLKPAASRWGSFSCHRGHCIGISCYVDCQIICRKPPFFRFSYSWSHLRQRGGMFVVPVREWALRMARRSTGITNMRRIYTTMNPYISIYHLFFINRDGTTFTQPAIRGQKPQKIYSL